MNPKKLEKIATEFALAAKTILSKHGVAMATLETALHNGSVVFKITPTASTDDAGGVTANAVRRYKKYGQVLGLPKLGAALAVAGKQYKLEGLSSDGKRIKATRPDTGATVHNLALADVQQAVAIAAGAEVKKLEASDEVVAVDQAAALLAQLAGKKPE